MTSLRSQGLQLDLCSQCKNIRARVKGHSCRQNQSDYLHGGIQPDLQALVSSALCIRTGKAITLIKAKVVSRIFWPVCVLRARMGENQATINEIPHAYSPGARLAPFDRQ